MQRLHYLLIGASGGALLGWLALAIVYFQFMAKSQVQFSDWRNSYSKYLNQRLPEGYGRWSVYAALIGALIGSAAVVFKVCARMPGHPLSC